jgi:hypothetical protein
VLQISVAFTLLLGKQNNAPIDALRSTLHYRRIHQCVKITDMTRRWIILLNIYTELIFLNHLTTVECASVAPDDLQVASLFESFLMLAKRRRRHDVGGKSGVRMRLRQCFPVVFLTRSRYGKSNSGRYKPLRVSTTT